MTYDELIGEILKDYSTKNFAQCIGNGEKIGKPLFQIKETDWNFLKRIASELKSELYCDIIDIRNMFYFGRPSNGNHEIEDVTNYKAHKNLKRFHEAGGYEEGYHDIDYFYYEVERREKYQIGDDIWIKDKKLYVNQYSAYALKDEVIYKYRLCRKNGVWQTKLYNSVIGGSSFEGKVLAVDGEKVKLHLGIDETQNEDEASWFPYAPPTGNVMYSMPIVGTSARLYFPNEESEDPIVTGCVRTNGSSCAKTSDTTKRYFGTEHGSEIEMTPGAVNIKGGSKQPLSISFDDSTGVTLKSPKNLNLNADNEIIIKTPASVKLKAQSQILVAKAGTQSGLSVETDMHIKGSNVIKDGSDRETYAPFDDEPREGKKPDPPPPPKEEKKPFDWGKLATNVLAGLAVAAVVAVATAVVAAAVVCTAGAAVPAIGAAVAAAGGFGGVATAAFATGMVMGAVGVASKAGSDIKSGEVSDIGEYASIAAKDAFAGAVCGAIFAPFTALGATTGLLGEIPTALQRTQSLVRTMVIGGTFNVTYDYVRDALDGRIPNTQEVLESYRDGALFSGYLHTGSEVLSEASPFIKNSVNKVSGEISDNAKALKYAWDNFEAPKGVKLGSNLGNMDFDGIKGFEDKYKEGINKIKNGNEVEDKANTEVSEDDPMSWNEFQADNAGKYDNAQMSKSWEEYKKDNYPNQGEHYLERPYIRQSTIDAVNTKTRFNSKGQAWDNNSKRWIDGTPDLGHKQGHEFWYERQQAEEKGWTQQEFNDYMNNPEFYQWEDASSNRSHKYEDKHD